MLYVSKIYQVYLLAFYKIFLKSIGEHNITRLSNRRPSFIYFFVIINLKIIFMVIFN